MTSESEARPRLKRGLVMIALLALSTGLFTLALVSYLRYADVWLRKPPRMPSCVRMARLLLMRDEPVTGSIPHMTRDGSTVYLRKADDRAVSCVSRVSTDAGKDLAAAFALEDPVAKARALASVVKGMPADPSADREALASYLIAAAAIRALPKQAETDAAREEIEQLNACRFAMRSPCLTRPPVPMIVWITGVPSSLALAVGLAFGLGAGSKAFGSRVAAWWRKRKADKLAKKPQKKRKSEAPES